MVTSWELCEARVGSGGVVASFARDGSLRSAPWQAICYDEVGRCGRTEEERGRGWEKTPSQVINPTLEGGGAEGLGREKWSNVPRLHTELTSLSSSGERGSSVADGGVLWVAYVVSQEKQQAPSSGVRFFFVVLSSMLRCSHCISLLRVITSLPKSLLPRVFAGCRNGHSPARCGSDKTGPLLVTALARGSKIVGSLNRATFMLQQKPSCASLLVALGIDLQSSRPVLASRWLVPCLCSSGPNAMDSRSIPQDRGRHVREQDTPERSTPCLEV